MLRKAILPLLIFILIISGCNGEEQPQEETAAEQDGQATTSVIAGGEDTQEPGETTSATTAGTAGDDEVTVGGFVVESPGGAETRIPEVTVERQKVQDYLDQIRPIVDDTVRDVSGLVQPEARLEDGNLTLGLEVTSLEEARDSVENGAEQLRDLVPPDELEPINQQLLEAYERALPAYREILDAAESRDPQQIGSAVEENLPRIERFNNETQAIIQDLEQAAGER